MDEAEIDDLWNLHDAYTVQQAAALIAGFDPNTVRWNMNGGTWFENEHGVTESSGINRVTTAFTSLANAINGGTLKATIKRSAWVRGWDEEPENGQKYTEEIETVESDMWPGLEIQRVKSRGVIYRVEPDWSLTTIACADLVSWLYSRGMRTGFFFPDASPNTPGYLDSHNPRYAPKLGFRNLPTYSRQGKPATLQPCLSQGLQQCHAVSISKARPPRPTPKPQHPRQRPPLPPSRYLTHCPTAHGFVNPNWCAVPKTQTAQ